MEWKYAAAAAAKSPKSCPTLCDPIDGSPPGSPVPGILQARTLEWVAISFSNAGKWKWSRSVMTDSLTTPWAAAYQAPPSMGFFQARVLEWGATAFSDESMGLAQKFVWGFSITSYQKPKLYDQPYIDPKLFSNKDQSVVMV